MIMCRRRSEFLMSAHDYLAARRPVLTCFAACLLVMMVAACGRRGPLEAPSSSAATPSRSSTSTGNGQPAASARLATSPNAATQDTPEDETDQQDPAESVLPTPTPVAPGGRKRGRAYEVPKQPFILDPLL
jgi:predicted small lipoprotein YifL